MFRSWSSLTSADRNVWPTNSVCDSSQGKGFHDTQNIDAMANVDH